MLNLIPNKPLDNSICFGIIIDCVLHHNILDLLVVDENREIRKLRHYLPLYTQNENEKLSTDFNGTIVFFEGCGKIVNSMVYDREIIKAAKLQKLVDLLYPENLEEEVKIFNDSSNKTTI